MTYQMADQYYQAAGADMLERIHGRRMEMQQTRHAVFWATVNFFITAILCFDMKFGNFIWTLTYFHPASWHLAYALTIICALAFVTNLIRCLKFFTFSSNINLTVEQQKLFGVTDFEPGFRIVRCPTDIKKLPVAGPQYSPSSYTSSSSFLCRPSPHLTGSYRCPSTPGSAPSTPLTVHQPMYGISTPGHVSSGSPYTSGSAGRSPGSSGRSSPVSSILSGSFSDSFNFSSRGETRGGRLTPNSALTSSFQQDLLAERTGIKTKSRASRSPNLSPLHSDDCMHSEQTLNQYLQDHDERHLQNLTSDASRTDGGIGSTSFWSYGRSFLDLLPSLRHYQYQLSPRSLLSTTCRDDSTDPSDSPLSGDAWSHYGVELEQVDKWVENLRKWLGKTILARLVTELDEVNALLVRAGSDDVQIGEASLTTLKQMAPLKLQQIPQLTALLPYIDLAPNQEYLVSRIRDLASGGCISAFKWNGGREYKGKPWNDSLPTDSTILLHLLCTYMDARLPRHPKHPDGKTFTNQHFVRVPDKPNMTERKDNLAIYQTRMFPPHFKVVIEDTVWNLKPGRHNLFHAILFFLYHIKTKEHGMLRRINLGMSGINILWVFEQ